MVEYISKYQNHYVFAHLFQNNCVLMIMKGVTMCGLFESRVFDAEIDCEQWPGQSFNTEKQFKPFNGSIFKVREYYDSTFPEVSAQDKAKWKLEEAGKLKGDDAKTYKIKY